MTSCNSTQSSLGRRIFLLYFNPSRPSSWSIYLAPSTRKTCVWILPSNTGCPSIGIHTPLIKILWHLIPGLSLFRQWIHFLDPLPIILAFWATSTLVSFEKGGHSLPKNAQNFFKFFGAFQILLGLYRVGGAQPNPMVSTHEWQRDSLILIAGGIATILLSSTISTALPKAAARKTAVWSVLLGLVWSFSTAALYVQRLDPAWPRYADELADDRFLADLVFRNTFLGNPLPDRSFLAPKGLQRLNYSENSQLGPYWLNPNGTKRRSPKLSRTGRSGSKSPRRISSRAWLTFNLRPV